jgi:uncharacterized protein Yka (UPF0111/DUF47 family)
VRFRLIPREEKFFADSIELADRIVSGATLLERMLSSDPPAWDTALQIKQIESECDALTHNIIQRLNRTFVTPIDREDIYNLATVLDDICDFMDQVADELNLYGVEEVPPEAIEQAGVILRAVSKIADAVHGLDGLKDISHHLIDVHTLEDEGDRIVRAATARLFRDGLDPLVVIRWKDIHHDLEQAVDSCEKAAHVLESIYLKNR